MRSSLTILSIVLFPGAALAQGIILSEWSHRAPVRPGSAQMGGLVEFALPPEVLDAAAAGLSDLRIVSDRGAEAGYVTVLPDEAAVRAPIPTKLINRVYNPGVSAQVTADFGSKTPKNRIEVLSPGTNFRRAVRVEGCDDGVNWMVVRDGALIFRFEGASDTARVEKTAIDLPRNNSKYLRVTVQNGPDDPERIDPITVMAYKVEKRHAEVERVAIAGVKVAENAKERTTEITLDLGFRRLPLHELELGFSDANFFRAVSVSGRDEEKTIVRLPAESGGFREKQVDVPWKPVRSASIYRLAGGGADKEESLNVDLRGVDYRHLLVRIENRDDRPLSFGGASVTRFAVRAAFAPGGGSAFFAYVGNPKARRPEYDLARFEDRLRKEGVTKAALGPLEPNPTRPPAADLPWSERHKWAIWAALILAAAVLALMVLRQARAAGRG